RPCAIVRAWRPPARLSSEHERCNRHSGSPAPPLASERATRLQPRRGTAMAEYRLYCFRESGNSYKPALMLALSGCDWEPRPVDYFSGETRGESYRSTINEMGEAPVLEHAGKRLTQSGVILTYLAERTGRFGGCDADERLEVLRWILFDNHKF